MYQFKRPIALLLALLMVMLAVPTTILSVMASANPVAKATLITAPIYKEYKTDPSPDGRGWESSPRGFYFEPIGFILLVPYCLCENRSKKSEYISMLWDKSFYCIFSVEI